MYHIQVYDSAPIEYFYKVWSLIFGLSHAVVFDRIMRTYKLRIQERLRSRRSLLIWDNKPFSSLFSITTEVLRQACSLFGHCFQLLEPTTHKRWKTPRWGSLARACTQCVNTMIYETIGEVHRLRSDPPDYAQFSTVEKWMVTHYKLTPALRSIKHDKSDSEAAYQNLHFSKFPAHRTPQLSRATH
jgi:hypothetical protein